MTELPKIGVNHPVFTILLEENPELFTTEGLEALLMDCVWRTSDKYKDRIKFHKSLIHDGIWTALSSIFDSSTDLVLLRRILMTPSEFDVELPHENKDDNFYSRIGSLLGGDFMTNKFIYDIIRDNIQDIQKQLDISGIKIRYQSIRDCMISYHVDAGELNLLEKDYSVLAQEKQKVVQFFLDVINIDPKYDLFIKDDEEELHPCDSSKLLAIAQSAVSASIYSESHEWRKSTSREDCWSGTSIKLAHPDKITLWLGIGEEHLEIFEAIHPDKSRKPF